MGLVWIDEHKITSSRRVKNYLVGSFSKSHQQTQNREIKTGNDSEQKKVRCIFYALIVPVIAQNESIEDSRFSYRSRMYCSLINPKVWPMIQFFGLGRRDKKVAQDKPAPPVSNYKKCLQYLIRTR
jgi:hypothetical protein